MSSNDFKSLTSLQSLYLSNNKIFSFGATGLTSRKLIQLGLENLNFSSRFVFDMKDINPNIKSLFLSQNNLNNITLRKLGSLNKLTMSNIAIDSLLRIRFDLINTIAFLDLSRNQINFSMNFTRIFSFREYFFIKKKDKIINPIWELNLTPVWEFWRKKCHLSNLFPFWS